MENLNSKIIDLKTDVTAVKEAKLLSDNKVRHTISNLSRWESSLEEIEESKDKIDEDSVKTIVKDTEIVKIKSFFLTNCVVSLRE